MDRNKYVDNTLYGGDFQISEWVISDLISRKEWETLLGIPIYSKKVRVPRRFYLQHLGEIHNIQFSAYMRMQ